MGLSAHSALTPDSSLARTAALVAVVNTKFPELGELLLHRLTLQFMRSYKRSACRRMGGCSQLTTDVVFRSCSVDDARSTLLPASPPLATQE